MPRVRNHKFITKAIGRSSMMQCCRRCGIGLKYKHRAPLCDTRRRGVWIAGKKVIRRKYAKLYKQVFNSHKERALAHEYDILCKR